MCYYSIEVCIGIINVMVYSPSEWSSITMVIVTRYLCRGVTRIFLKGGSNSSIELPEAEI